MFHIDPLSRTPVYEQLVQQMESFLLSGAMRPGDQLPSVRSVALEHSINPRTILKAYSDLDAKGLITVVPGKGYFVRQEALQVLNAAGIAKLDGLRSMLHDMALAGVDKQQILSCVQEVYASINSVDDRKE